jgi:hypothetical protein
MKNSNNFGTEMEIVKVLKYPKIVIRFNDKFKLEKEVYSNNFKNGTVKNPYDISVLGKGYIGDGKYLTKNSNGKRTVEYSIWTSMMDRCYGEREQYPVYIDCEVCEEWHNFQNFAEWYEINYYKVGNERMHLDKDILVKRNRLYSPETCMIVPQRINMIFMTKEKGIDADLPNAINRSGKGYISSYNGKYLGDFETLEEAINEHDRVKRIHIKQVVKEYGDKLPPKVQNALLNW